jgi:hypothetical protein
MRLKDYFLGVPIRLESRLTAADVAERINAAAGSTVWPFTTGVVGRVSFGVVRLRFRSSFAEYNAKPILAGRIREARSGSILALRYRAPAWVYAFDVFWYSFLAFIALFPLFGDAELNPELTTTDFALIAAGLAAFLVFPFVLHFIGTRNSDFELAELLDFLAGHAEARPQPPRLFKSPP